jgi:signal peptidase
MNVKSLNELNFDFKNQIDQTGRETLANYQKHQSANIEPLKPPLTEIGVKSLNELNNEFKSQTQTNNVTGTGFETDSFKVEKSALKLEYIFAETPGKHIDSKKNHALFAAISDILFYLAIFTVMLSILISGENEGEPRMFMGYSYFTVLTFSMQDEIPQGSFILVRRKEAGELKTGDNITYMRDVNTAVTHKIIDIYDNYENSGAKGFQTKGVNNVNPDKDIVYESNVVGKVVFVLPGAGAAMSYLRENIYIAFIGFGLFIVLSFLIRRLFVMKNIKKCA